MPPFWIADLVRDADVLAETRLDAQTLIASDPGLALPQHALLRKRMLARYGKALELGDVG
jgi:RecG-like helicase